MSSPRNQENLQCFETNKNIHHITLAGGTRLGRLHIKTPTKKIMKWQKPEKENLKRLNGSLIKALRMLKWD